MKNRVFAIDNDGGFVLITTMMILVVLTLIGLSATNTTIIELMISGNDKVHKQTFYQTDGSTELAERLLFENAVCYVTNGSGFTANFGGAASMSDTIIAEDIDFSQSLVAENSLPLKFTPTSANRDMVIYPQGSIAGGTITSSNIGAANDAANSERTEILAQGSTIPNKGFNLSYISGYEGLAYGSSGGGVVRKYTVATTHRGIDNSQSVINVRWRLNTSILNSASSYDCSY